MTPERRDELVALWRGRADALDTYARGMRREGDVREAEDAEQAATDYRIAADELEPDCELLVRDPAAWAAVAAEGRKHA